MNEQDREVKEQARIDRQQVEQGASAQRIHEEQYRTEEQARQDRARQDEQRRQDENRRQDEQRRQDQLRQEERRKQDEQRKQEEERRKQEKDTGDRSNGEREQQQQEQTRQEPKVEEQARQDKGQYKPKDYNLYGNPGWTAEEVEILYKREIVEPYKAEKAKQVAAKEQSPVEKLHAKREAMKSKTEQAMQERSQTRELERSK